MKKTLSILLSILMVFYALFPSTVLAEDSSGSWDNGSWNLKNGVLTISGTDTIPNTLSLPKSEIKRIVIDNGITTIDEDVFCGCSNLKEVCFPESLTRINRYAFENCYKLEKADLPGNLKFVGVSAFKDCNSLKKIVLPKCIKTICGAAFSNCTSLKGKLVIPKDVTLNRAAFSNCKSITELTFEDGFNIEDWDINVNCFNGCESLKTVYIPGSLKVIPPGYFKNCISLNNVKICEGVEIVNGFSGCTALEKITLPKSVKIIYSSAFYNCKKLKSVKIQSKLDMLCIEAFLDCQSLKSIKIPFGVDTVEEHFCGYTTVSKDEKQSLEYKPIKNFKIYGKKCKALTNYCKNNGFKFIDMYDVKNATATMKSQTYNGKAKKPSVTLKLAGVTLTEGTDYTVKYSNNTKVGTAKATITGKGKYKGTLTKTFKINPKSTELTKLTPKSKSFKAYWKKNKSQTSGYQLQYSVYKSFKNAKKATIKGYKTGAKTIKDLKSNKKYFVRVRAYKVVDGKKYYSKWSESKSVKTE